MSAPPPKVISENPAAWDCKKVRRQKERQRQFAAFHPFRLASANGGTFPTGRRTFRDVENIPFYSDAARLGCDLHCPRRGEEELIECLRWNA